MRARIMTASAGVAVAIVGFAAPAFADYYPTPASAKGYEIENKALYLASPTDTAPSFVDATLYSYQPYRPLAHPQGVNAVCGRPDGSVARVSVGPQTADNVWNPGSIHGYGLVFNADYDSTFAWGLVNVTAYDSRTKDTAHIEGLQITNNQTHTRLFGRFTVTIWGPIYVENGNNQPPTQVGSGTLTCRTDVAPLPDSPGFHTEFSNVLNDTNPNDPS